MPRLWQRVALAVMIHDLGKCCCGFQKTVRGEGKFRQRHEVLSLAVLPWLLPADPHGDLPWIAAAVVTHHKDLGEIGELYPDELDYDGLEQLRAEVTSEFFRMAEQIFWDAFWQPLSEFAGLSVVPPSRGWAVANPVAAIRPILRAVFELSKQVRKQSASSPDAIAGRFLRGLLLLADHAGSAGERFGMLEQITSEAGMMSAIGVTGASLYPHQRDLAAGNATLIAPTGSGKTEASMLWAARTGSQSTGFPVLFYVLPYQASINAMQARLAAHFGGSKVALQHSRAALAIYRQLLDRDYQPKLAALIARKERSLANLHAKPVRILTPYQLLRSAFQFKAHEALWTDASGSLMIFDEIHAYEPARLGMIFATLRHLTRDLGVRALVMSATMPMCLLRCVREILPDGQHVAATPATFRQFQRHRVHLLDGDLLDTATADRIRADAAEGKSVLAAATTVGRAQELYRELRRSLGDRVSLLHGRFHAEDRFEKEKELALKRGPKGTDPVVLVATQVVEVSLDIDFDVLYSDPAPLEALLQRFGRVNRRRRVPLRDVFVMKATPEGSPVYANALIAAALHQLAMSDGAPLDESMVQQMLNAIYDGTIGDSWIAELTKHMDDFQRNVLDTVMPFRSSEEIEKQFDELFDGFQVLPKSLEPEYERRLDQDELSAPALLVPITRGQFFSIKPTRRHHTWVADRPYSSQEGLDVRGERRADGI
jgi:CRISPR-associated endonuclease/helicase Cas3